MDFELTPEQKKYAQEFRAYLETHLTPEVKAEGVKFMIPLNPFGW